MTNEKPTFMRAGETLDEWNASTATLADSAIVDAYREALALLTDAAEHFRDVAAKHREAMGTSDAALELQSNMPLLDRIRRALAVAMEQGGE